MRLGSHTLCQVLACGSALCDLAMCMAVERWHYSYFFGLDLLCGSTGTVFGPGFGASGFFLGVGDGVDLL